MTCESCFNPSRAHTESERNSKRSSRPGPETTELFPRKDPSPPKKSREGHNFDVFLSTHKGWDCSCVCACVCVCVYSSSVSVCWSERETVRVFKMPCLWAQSVALIIHDNSFLTSTSSHSHFRLLRRSHSAFCCNPYWKISPTSYRHGKLVPHNVRYCAGLVSSRFIPTVSSVTHTHRS